MEEFFNTLYYYTNVFYGELLDTYLYETTPGYLHIGLFLFVSTIIVCLFFYYLLAPVRKQTLWWFVCAGANAIVNILFALWYSMTPLINNEIPIDESWTYLDCDFLGFANALWSFVFFVIASLILKWGSIAKFVPFQKF